jgi:hypothetical protein
MTIKSLLIFILIVFSASANAQQSLRQHIFYLEYKEGTSMYPTNEYRSEPTPHKSYSVQWLATKKKYISSGFRLGLSQEQISMSLSKMDYWSGHDMGVSYSSNSSGHKINFKGDYSYLMLDANCIISLFGNHRKIQLLIGMDLCSKMRINREILENSYINYQSSSSGHPEQMPDGSYTFVTYHSYSESVSKATNNIDWLNKEYYIFPILQAGLETTFLQKFHLRAMARINPARAATDGYDYNVVMIDKFGLNLAVGYGLSAK